MGPPTLMGLRDRRRAETKRVLLVGALLTVAVLMVLAELLLGARS